MAIKGCSSSSRRSSFLLAATLLVSFCATRATASSIPMWEFLTRDEKMNHLYRVFSQEVVRFCDESFKPDCSKSLLLTGLRNLANLEDDRLDEMDPFQRGAKKIIWRELIGASEDVIASPKNNNNNKNDNKDHLSASRPGQQQQYHQQSIQSNDYLEDPLAFGDSNHLAAEESSFSADYASPPSTYLSDGPWAVRVLPDGSPVPEDRSSSSSSPSVVTSSSHPASPRDEDIEDLRADARPAFHELEAYNEIKSPAREMMPPAMPLIRQPPIKKSSRFISVVPMSRRGSYVYYHPAVARVIRPIYYQSIY
ncbi:hypothetical protein TKK_0018676 [Trichogramma kaykai]